MSAGLRHRALLYEDPAEFVAAAAPYVHEGLAREDAVMIAVPPRNADALREALGPDAAGVGFAPVEEWFRLPATAIATLEREMRDGPRRLRALGEIPFGRRTDPREWTRAEAVLSAAFGAADADVLCAYDLLDLPDAVVADAHRTHPAVLRGTGEEASAGHEPPEAVLAALDAAPLPPPPREAPHVAFGDHPAPARHFLRERAAAAGLREAALEDLLIAAGEIVNNAILYGSMPRSVRAWVAGDRLVCEVRDAGPGLGDPCAGFRLPGGRAHGGRGVWIARQVCERVDIRGARVRLQVPLTGS